MKVATPHYLLFSESSRKNTQGQWHFVLQTVDGAEQFEASDDEPNAAGERLELLAVVRGLEALEQPSRVTLVTPSKYVNRGLAYGLDEWRANDWQWEHYGEMVPVKNRDLWQRVDRALTFHQLDCRTWRFDLPHLRTDEAHAQPAARAATSVTSKASGWTSPWRRAWAACGRAWSDYRRALATWTGPCSTRLLPLAWFE